MIPIIISMTTIDLAIGATAVISPNPTVERAVKLKYKSEEIVCFPYVKWKDPGVRNSMRV
jgi:hypothetical protein